MSLTTDITIHTNKNKILITDAIIHSKGKYIIVISGLDKDFVNNICLEMAQILKYTYLSYLDNPISDNMRDYNNIFYRVEYLLNIKPQGMIISLLSFPEKYTMIDVKLHINLSINQTYFDNIKNKYKYPNDILIDYNDILKSNKINKYINIKLDSDLNQIKQTIFDTIIINIEKHYYGDKYDKIEQYKNNQTSDNSHNNKTDNKDSNNSHNKKTDNKDSDNSHNNSHNKKTDSSENSDSYSSDSNNSHNNKTDSSESSHSKKLNNKKTDSSESSDSYSSNSSESSNSYSSNSKFI
jgi:hypothetical protein